MSAQPMVTTPGNRPDRWTLILTGPNSGCIAPHGDVWAHCPDHFERVDIVEMGKAVTPAPAPAIAVPAPVAKEPTKIIVNEPVDDLARSLGIVYNDLIPHNAGWFVPGYQRGYASAADAVRGLFAVLKQAAVERGVIDALPDHAQPSLF